MHTMHAHKVLSLRALARGLRHVDLDDGDAFMPDFRHGYAPVKHADADADAFGEEFITSATSGEGVGESARDEVSEEFDVVELPVNEMTASH